MNDTVLVTLAPNDVVHPIEEEVSGDRIPADRGTSVGAFLTEHHGQPNQVLAAIVDNHFVDLSEPLIANCRVVPVTYASRIGVLVYRRSASLILLEAARRLFGTVPISIGQALGNGYSYQFHKPDPLSSNGDSKSVANLEQLTSDHCDRLRDLMEEIVAEDLVIEREVVSIAEAKRLFRSVAQPGKIRLLQTWRDNRVAIVRCGEFFDIHHLPVARSTGQISHFELRYDGPNVILRFPHRKAPTTIAPLEDTPKLKQVYRESQGWLRRIGVRTVGQLNQMTLDGHAGEIIRIAEGLHEKKIAQIADQICQRNTQLVLVAGPSSSGKTTFSKRLSLQLQVNGVQPVALSTDNFYVNRVDTPLDANGKYDFESIEAIDLSLFNEILCKLLRGEEVLTPRYDFTVGERKPKDKWHRMQLRPEQVLVVEGIHGLNPRLTEAVDEQSKFRIYINALTQLCLDNHNSNLYFGHAFSQTYRPRQTLPRVLGRTNDHELAECSTRRTKMDLSISRSSRRHVQLCTAVRNGRTTPLR